jgi:ribosome-associated protein
MPDLDTPPDDFEPDEPPSKTQRKKASHALQDLGEELVRLPDDRLGRIDMPERLRDAILDYKRTRSHEGKRRQMQFIGKLMRGTDEEPLREAVAAYQLGAARDSLDLHRAEAWRTRLIADDTALTAWMEEHPGTELQPLRAMIRQARKDATAQPEQRSGRAFRELFQFIKQAMLEAPAAAAATGTGTESDHE